jgi:opacity protein-like surface antigen
MMTFSKVHSIAVMAGFLVLGMDASVWATQVEGPYAGVGLGFTKVDGVTYDLLGAPVVAHPAEFDSDQGLQLRAGWAFGGPRLEVEWADLGVNAKNFGRVGEIEPADGKLGVDTWMVNLFYDFDLESKFIPYLGVGVGQANVKAEGISKDTNLPDRTGFVDGGGAVFAWQVILGVAYQWNEHLGATLDYRIVKTGNIDHDYGVGCIPGSLTECTYNSQLQMDYGLQSLSLGLRWVF